MDKKEILSLMLKSRYFEEKIDSLFKEGKLYGTTHLNIGQEASHTGLIAGLDEKDWIVPTHRCHGFNIARGTKIERMFSEMMGLRDGICRGLGGSMHMSDVSTCNAGSSAIVGSGVPIATGLAFALKQQKKDNIAVAIFGDGATSRGSVHEAMKIASVWNIPVLFYLENNHYGMSAKEENAISTDDIAARADGYKIRHIKIDGNDVLLVRDTVKKAREYIIKNQRPFFIEVDTYRLCGHSKSDKLVYRDRSEEEAWKKKDPIDHYSNYLIDGGIIDESEYVHMKEDAEKAIEDAYSIALSKSGDVMSLNELDSYLFAPSPVSYNESGEKHEASYRDAIYEALDEILSEDRYSFMLGEDIGKYGGCFSVTKDLYKKHPGKVFETPVSEEGFTALAVGSSMLGMHPIVEIMYADFSTLASDPLINHAAKTYFMSAGQLNCPMIYRTPIGSGTGHGSQHTANIEAMFLNTPGLIVVAPSDAYSAKALLKSASRENNPVLFFEHKGLYNEEGVVGDANTYLPLKKAIVKGSGKDLLLISYSHAMATSIKAARKYSDSVTFIDLATISPLDEETIVEHASFFSKILLVEDTPVNGSVADSVISIISRKCKGEKEIRLIAARSLPIPFAKELEAKVIPTVDQVEKEIEELLSL